MPYSTKSNGTGHTELDGTRHTTLDGTGSTMLNQAVQGIMLYTSSVSVHGTGDVAIFGTSNRPPYWVYRCSDRMALA